MVKESTDTKEFRGVVDSEVKRKFDAAVKFTGMKPNQAYEEALKLFTEKHIKSAGGK
jgi:hypothetical protein